MYSYLYYIFVCDVRSKERFGTLETVKICTSIKLFHLKDTFLKIFFSSEGAHPLKLSLYLLFPKHNIKRNSMLFLHKISHITTLKERVCCSYTKSLTSRGHAFFQC